MKFLKNNLTSLLAIITVVASAYCARSNADVTGFYIPFTTHAVSCASVMDAVDCPKDGFNNEKQSVGFHTDKFLTMTMTNSFNSRSFYVGNYKSWHLESGVEVFTTLGLASGYDTKEQPFLIAGLSPTFAVGVDMPITERFGLVVTYVPAIVFNAGFSWKF